MKILQTVDLPVWRLLPLALLDTPCATAKAPEGRFHHSGQAAAYASLSAQGAAIAIQRYLGDGVERKLVPMQFTGERIVDQRGNTAASVVWQDVRASGALAPTWAFSDAARAAGAQAMLYSSRSRPDLSHIVVFEPNCLHFVGPVTAYEP